MKEVTRTMIKDFRIMKLGYDFMGYKVDRTKDLSFHHLIIPHRESKAYGIGEGYLYWNGAILRQDTSHEYAHVIERIDPEIFLGITSEMIDMNIKGYLDSSSLRQIRSMLEYFEREHCSDRSKKGKLLIKNEYLTERIRLWKGKIHY